MADRFTKLMHEHWTQRLGLTASYGLIQGWQQLELAAQGLTSRATHWQVLQLPTGSGKTEALKVLCAMQDPERHPGILIVTKFQDSADDVAKGINDLAQRTVACAVHSSALFDEASIPLTPVLVTTHAAYRLALKEHHDTGTNLRMQRLSSYIHGERSWTIIDEAFDWTDSYNLNLSNLRAMIGDLAGALSIENEPMILGLQTFALGLSDRVEYGKSDCFLKGDLFDCLSDGELNHIIDAVLSVPESFFSEWIAGTCNDIDELGVGAQSAYLPIKQEYLKLLQQLKAVANIGYAWTSMRGGKQLLHSSRSLLRKGGSCGIVLDATASIDPRYGLMLNTMKIIQRPAGIRAYNNVTLNVSRGHSVGKDHIAKNIAKDWPILWGELETRLAGKHVLVCAHKCALGTISGYGLAKGHVHFANWGALDGKNDWNECDTLVLYGLPYLDDIVPAQIFMAHQGPQTDDWFAGIRRYGDHTDIRSALNDGFIAASVVQAVNRVRCRKPIDAIGNCAPTDIFLLLPNGRVGETTLQALKQQMPGIRVVNWYAPATKRKARKVPTETKLTAFFKEAAHGSYIKSEIANKLHINISSLERMTAKMSCSQSEISKTMAFLDVTYHSANGRGNVSYFTKHQNSL